MEPIDCLPTSERGGDPLLISPEGPEPHRLVLRLLARATRARCAILYLPDQSDALQLTCAGEGELKGRPGESPLVRLLCRWVFHTLERVVLDRARQHPVGRDIVTDPEFGDAGIMGVPVRAPDGRPIGALCVLDEGPRRWEDGELELLTEAAAGIARMAGVPAELGPPAELESENALRALFEAAPIGMWLVEPETGRVSAFNARAAQLSGYEPGEALDLGIGQLFAADDMPPTDEWLAPREGARALRTEARLRRRDGSEMEVDLACLRVAIDGRPAAVVMARDRSSGGERLERSRFVADASALLATTLDYTTRLASLARLAVPTLGDFCVVDVVEPDGSVRRIEAAHADPARDDLVRELLRFPPLEHREEGVFNALRTGRSVLIPTVDDVVMDRAAQTPEHARAMRRLGPRAVLCVPLVSKGRTLGAISFVMAESGRGYEPADVELAEEIAQRAAVAIDNARLYQRAQQAIRAREEVLSVVSHELRNPLNAITLTLDLLLGTDPEGLPRSHRQRLESIRTHSDQMVRLIDDLLDVIRLEAGRLTLRVERIEVAPLVREALASVQLLADSRGVHLVERVPEGLPSIVADRSRIVQVFVNLLVNAIRAVEAGGTVAVRASQDRKEIRFAVVDTGTGVAPEKLRALFDRSSRAAETPVSAEGLGLGLAIASGIVRAHRGQIWAESEPGRGSTFSFTLPVSGPEGVAPSERRAPVMADEPLPLAGPAHAPVDRARPTEPTRTGPAHRGRVVEPREILQLGADPASSTDDPAESIRRGITRAVHLGKVVPGDRLPSIRQLAKEFGTSKNSVVRTYRQLETEGVIESRERSGVYVANAGRPQAGRLFETGEWLAEVVTEACEHQLRIPVLPDLIRRWTVGLRLRCACVESDADYRSALCAEYSNMFGFECVPVPSDRIRPPAPSLELDPDDVPPEIRDADLLMTTAFHAPIVRRFAEALDKPMVVVTADPEIVQTIEKAVRTEGVRLVCADRRFGERMRELYAGPLRESFQFTLADDAEAIDRLDPTQPVLLTRAARDIVGDRPLRLLSPHFPAFANDTARDLARIVIQLNLAAERRAAEPKE